MQKAECKMQNDGIGFADDLKFMPERHTSILHFINSRLKARIDVGCNIPDVVLHIFIPVLQGNFHFADVVKNGGVVLGEFLADVGKRKVGELPDQIHGYLTGFGSALVLLSAPENHLVYIVELAAPCGCAGRFPQGSG